MRATKNKPKKQAFSVVAVLMGLFITGVLFLQCEKGDFSSYPDTDNSRPDAGSQLLAETVASSPTASIELATDWTESDARSEDSTSIASPSRGAGSGVNAQRPVNNIQIEISGLKTSLLESPYILETIEWWNQVIGRQFFILKSATKTQAPYTCGHESKIVKMAFDSDFSIEFTDQVGSNKMETGRLKMLKKCKFIKEGDDGIKIMSTLDGRQFRDYVHGHNKAISNIRYQSHLKNIHIMLNPNSGLHKMESYLSHHLFLYLGTIFALYKIDQHNYQGRSIHLKTEGLAHSVNKQFFNGSILWWNNHLGHNVFVHINPEQVQKIQPTITILVQGQPNESFGLEGGWVRSKISNVQVSFWDFYTEVKEGETETSSGLDFNRNQTCKPNGTIRRGHLSAAASAWSSSSRCSETDSKRICKLMANSGRVCYCEQQCKDVDLQEQFLIRLGAILALDMLNVDI